MEIIMEALPALGDAWGLILQPVVLGYLVLGVLMGLCIGVSPALAGLLGYRYCCLLCSGWSLSLASR